MTVRRTSSLIESLDRLPPCLVRLVARNGHSGHRLSLAALSDRSGLSYGAVQRLSEKKSWKDTPPWMIDAFCSACGVDPLRPRAKLAYLRRMLSDPNGYKKLSARSGAGSPKNVLRMLQTLSE